MFRDTGRRSKMASRSHRMSDSVRYLYPYNCIIVPNFVTSNYVCLMWSVCLDCRYVTQVRATYCQLPVNYQFPYLYSHGATLQLVPNTAYSLYQLHARTLEDKWNTSGMLSTR